jgi:hypothetical protein
MISLKIGFGKDNLTLFSFGWQKVDSFYFIFEANFSRRD